MRDPDPTADPEDYFAETRMSFGDHIEELRTHLIRAIYGFVIGMAVAVIFAKVVFHVITAPVQEQLMEFYNRRVEKVAKELKEGSEDLKALDQPKDMPVQVSGADLRQTLRKIGLQVAEPEDAGSESDVFDLSLRIKPLEWSIRLAAAQRQVGRPPMLSTMNVMEAFMVYFKIVAVTGLVISSPWVFWQLWSFIAAGLYPQEKKYVHLYLPLSLGLFLAGVFMCQFMVIPKAIHALLWFNEWLDLEPDLRLNEWLTFAILLPLVFGLSFQTPLVMLFLGKIGIFDADSFRRKRRIAWFAMAAFAAFITPIDALSMLLLWIPMCGLYELGILMVSYSAPPPEPVSDTAEELVEV
jgi:sec-independent protein translocase protein TatC